MKVTMYLLLNHEDHLLTLGVVWPSAKDFLMNLARMIPNCEYGEVKTWNYPSRFCLFIPDIFKYL